MHRIMKKITTWMSVVVLFSGALVGCGSKAEKKPDQGSNTTSEASVTSTGATTEAAPVAVTADTPEQAVNTFLDALKTGNDKAAAALLTTKARAETAKHDMVVEPPGAPNATYNVGRVEHPDDNPNAAYVSCLWTEKFADGQEESYEVVWVLRREDAGWRVAGMATQLADAQEPVFLDFEDLAAMENAVQDAETANAADVVGVAGAEAASQAQTPPATLVR
jgi:hypothetical protein